jgi:hypothetical protein
MEVLCNTISSMTMSVNALVSLYLIKIGMHASSEEHVPT